MQCNRVQSGAINAILISLYKQRSYGQRPALVQVTSRHTANHCIPTILSASPPDLGSAGIPESSVYLRCWYTAFLPVRTCAYGLVYTLPRANDPIVGQTVPGEGPTFSVAVNIADRIEIWILVLFLPIAG